LFTISAFPPEEQVAEQGDVIIGPDGGPAIRTKGSRGDDGQILGKAVNAHIQKASDAAAHQKYDKGIEFLYHPPAPLLSL
jgi:hypothetical protein